MDFKETLKDDMETIIDLIEDGKLIKAREKIITMDAVDIELLLDEIPREKMLRVFRMLPKTLAADTFAYMKSDQQQYIIESIFGDNHHDGGSEGYDCMGTDSGGFKMIFPLIPHDHTAKSRT